MHCSLLPRDPDNVVLCLLATDEEDVKDVALQIHFTLIQAFCCENDISILRVNNTRRLAEILGGLKKGGEPMDLHCILVTVGYTLAFLSCLPQLCNVFFIISPVFKRFDFNRHLFIVLLPCSNGSAVIPNCGEHVCTCSHRVVF